MSALGTQQPEYTHVCGLVHGARWDVPVGGQHVRTAACGYSLREAERSVRSLRTVLDILHSLGQQTGRTGGPEFEAPPERLLRIGEFAVDAEEVDGPLLPARGVFSGLIYGVPAQIVLQSLQAQLPSARGLAGVVHGGPGAHHDELVSRAVADVLATDIAVRWWQNPRPPLHRLDVGRLAPESLPGSGPGTSAPAVGTSASAPGTLSVEGYAWPDLPFELVLAVIHGPGAGFGVAAASDRHEALRLALLRAHSARLTAWHSAEPHLELLRLNSRPAPHAAGPARIRVSAPVTGVTGARTDWREEAHRRFGHEPLVADFPAPDGGRVVRALCPGAVTHHPLVLARPECPL